MAEDPSELLARCRRGDEDAIRLLVTRFQDWARDLATAILRDSHLAEDATQAAFMRALDRLHELHDPAAFPGWFRQVVRTECSRISGRRREGSLPDQADPPPPASSPSLAAEVSERRRIVREALASLTPARRRAVELFYFENLSCDEVAEILHVPQGTVKRRLHDARQRLRQTLERHLPL